MIPRDAHARYERRFDPIAYFGASRVATWLAARDLSAGAITNWIDRAHAYDFAGTATRDTSINGQPAVTGNGTSNILTSGANIAELTGKSAVTVILGMAHDTGGTTVPVLVEHSASPSLNPGSFTNYIDTSSTRLHNYARGDVGPNDSYFIQSAPVLQTPAIYTLVKDFTLAGAGGAETAEVRKNGAAVSVTALSVNDNTGTLGAYPMSLFGRVSGGTNKWNGHISDLLVIAGTLTAAEKLRCERMIGRSSKIGV